LDTRVKPAYDEAGLERCFEPTRSVNAQRLADPLCGSAENADVTEMLQRSKLCG
jgi:hypothetical protein